MSLQRSIQFGGVADPRLHDLVDTPDRIVVRTHNHADPSTFWHTLPGVRPMLSFLVAEDAFPESSVYIYRIAGTPDPEAFRTQLKTTVRAANDPRIEYIGTVLMYARSGIYQIYTGNLFLKFHTGVSSSVIRRIQQEHQLSLKKELFFAPNAFFLEAAEGLGRDIFDLAQNLLDHPEVEYAHPELVVRRKNIHDNPALRTGSGLQLNHDWFLQKIHASKAWETTRGKGVRICVIDDGLELNHPAFAGRIVAQRDMMDRNNTRPPAHQFAEWHGTACAGIACSADPRAPGVAPEALLMPIRSMGLGSVLESEAFYWAAQNGADIISCSWGPPDGDPLNPSDNLEPYPIPDHTNLAIRYAARQGRGGKGCAVFFAAGNGNEPVWYDEYASHPDVMAVGATNLEDQKTIYSDYQSPLFCCFPSGEFEPLDGGLQQLYGVTATDRLGPDGQDPGDYYPLFAGTSAACPGVAGVAALALSLAPNLQRHELKDILARSCLRVGDPARYNADGQSELFGYGLIQADLVIKNTLQYLNPTNAKTMNTPSPTVKAISLHIGINNVDSGYYKNNVPQLFGCVGDMEKMEKLAKEKGFSTKAMRNQEATREAILQFLEQQAVELNKDDILLISYAGHGASIRDEDGDESDNFDEAWVTYSGFLSDDELHRSLSLFREGVRVLLVSDSCHSGTMNRQMAASRSNIPIPRGGDQRARFLPPDAVDRILKDNNRSARALKSNDRGRSESMHKASILLMAACQDDQYAMENDDGGVFTTRLMDVLSENGSSIDYTGCISAIRMKMPTTQIPKLEPLGQATDQFAAQVAFSIQQAGLQGTATPPVKKAKKKSRVVNLLVETDKRMLRSFPPPGSRDGVVRELSVINKVVDGTNLDGRTEWDKAYQLLLDFNDAGINFVEPDIPGDIYADPGTDAETQTGRSTDALGYLPTYPNPEEDPHRAPLPFIWHLDNEHSQLQAANELVFPGIITGDEPPVDNNLVKIAHIDTGFYPHSPTMPINIDMDADVRFKLNGDAVNDAEDSDKPLAIAEQEGHGNGTLSILAGRYVTRQDTGGAYEGYFGAIPFARVLPLKISETVALLSGKKFQSAVEYAIKNKVDVISMSMAGWPSRAMADAVNKAYENGIVIVSAASNCFEKGFGKVMPPTVLYPARFDRTIGVVGAMVNQKPYLVRFGKQARADGFDYMQMCYGPKEAMKTAIAGYTPNISWFNKNHDAAAQTGRYFIKSGSGTSSATPQVAAAAALYIQKYKSVFDALPSNERWKIVEVVKKALFESAAKDTEYEPYFGNGILRAKDALDEKFDASKLLKTIKDRAPEAKTKGFFKTLFSLYQRAFGLSASQIEMILEMEQTELLQLMHREPALHRFLEYDLTDENVELSETDMQDLVAAVLNSNLASDQLKRRMSAHSKNTTPAALYTDPSGALPFAAIPAEGRKCKLSFRAENMNINLVRETRGAFEDETNDMVVDEFEIEIGAMSTRGNEAWFEMVTDLEDQGRQGAVLTQFEEGGEVLYQWSFDTTPGTETTERSLRTFSTGGAGTFSIALDTFKQKQTRGGGFKPGRFILKLFSWIKPKTSKVLKEALSKSAEGKYGLYFYDLDRAKDEKGNAWIPESELPKVWAEMQKPGALPLLFLIPGTFSKIEKGFDELLCDNDKVKALAAVHFRYALGFNMPTATHSVRENVEWLDKKLGNVLNNKPCRILARSRGGLVARYAFEKQWKNKSPLKLEKLIMTGTPNQGTPLAEAKNWKDLINIVTNLLGRAFAPASPAFETIGIVLKAIVNNLSALPGLDEQRVDAEFMIELNKGVNGALLKKYYVATSNFEPSNILKNFFDQIIFDKHIFKGMANDKIVPLDSARFKLKLLPNNVTIDDNNVIPLGQSERVNHFGYLNPKHERPVKWVLDQLTKLNTNENNGPQPEARRNIKSAPVG